MMRPAADVQIGTMVRNRGAWLYVADKEILDDVAVTFSFTDGTDLTVPADRIMETFTNVPIQGSERPSMKKGAVLVLIGIVLGVLVLPLTTAVAEDFSSNHPLTRIAEELKEISSTLKNIEKKLK